MATNGPYAGAAPELLAPAAVKSGVPVFLAGSVMLRLRSFGEWRSTGSLCGGCLQPGCFVAAGRAG